jgi:hypothetical protein
MNRLQRHRKYLMSSAWPRAFIEPITTDQAINILARFMLAFRLR